ncbi:GTP cyclohydrolase I-like protein [Bombardia bombarda]|uniref:GTP cyclohydrolase 1 n=1 Tax=Bombardia bombarda TaxID=252184 RepID=A0AA39U2D9_9PEZI|nr:GTP cyclohydrolase I-like protein [Bombardia bombarda]
MVQFEDQVDSDGPSGASVVATPNGGEKKDKNSSTSGRNGKNHNSKKRGQSDDGANSTAATNGGHPPPPAERRSSVSKPARDFRDKPEPPAKKKKRRKMTTQTTATTLPIAAAATTTTTTTTTAAADAALIATIPAAAPTPPDLAESSTRSPSPVIDFDGLSRPSCGTRERLEETDAQKELRLTRMKGAVRTLLECVGEDADREGLLATPERYAKAMLFFTKGYQENVRDIVNGAIFQEGHNEMVIVKDIEVFSMCEHHLVPFTGKMHIGYIPNNAVIGISKLPRIAEMFARRLQIQERLTREVANAIMEILKPQGVAVVMESSHLCMVMRGVQKTSTTTITSCVLGCFERKEKTRNEFLSLIGVNRR